MEVKLDVCISIFSQIILNNKYNLQNWKKICEGGGGGGQLTPLLWSKACSGCHTFWSNSKFVLIVVNRWLKFSDWLIKFQK